MVEPPHSFMLFSDMVVVQVMEVPIKVPNYLMINKVGGHQLSKRKERQSIVTYVAYF
jgi:hypothetical protein